MLKYTRWLELEYRKLNTEVNRLAGRIEGHITRRSLKDLMTTLNKFLRSEFFLATFPPCIMLYYYMKREREMDELTKTAGLKSLVPSSEDQITTKETH